MKKIQNLFGEQAGIRCTKNLRKVLRGPVCGSVHHPHKAKISEGGVDEKTVEEAKKIRDEAERKRAAAQEKYQEVRAQFETGEKRFLEKGILGKMKNRRKTGLQNMRACLRKKDRI